MDQETKISASVEYKTTTEIKAKADEAKPPEKSECPTVALSAISESPTSCKAKPDEQITRKKHDSEPDSTSDKSGDTATFIGSEEGEVHDDLPADPMKPFELHPLKEELEFFKTPAEQLQMSSVIGIIKSIDETPFQYIQTKEQLDAAIDSLKSEKEIAVDLEYCDQHYKALTCLIQISTKTEDYIFDAITLKEELHVLSELFSNKNILKVFHACDNDLKWLQQDFKLFVINLFDTQIAMKLLGYKALGLADELRKYNVNKDKAMQRADFSLRPVSQHYIDYARTDTHYLLSIYHNLKNKLIERGLLSSVLVLCNDKCKVVYGPQEDTSVGIRKQLEAAHQRQLFALESLNKWRHKIAQYQNISPGAVLSRKSLYSLVTELPLDPNRVLLICNHSKIVKKDLDEIMQILNEAKPVHPYKFRNPRGKPIKQQMPKNITNTRKRKFPVDSNLIRHAHGYEANINEGTDLRFKLQNVSNPRFKRQRKNFHQNR